MPRPPNIPKRKAAGVYKAMQPPAQSKQIEKLVAQGLLAHQQGRLEEAQSIYVQVLKSQPQNFMALQLMGAFYLQTKNHLQAIDLLSQAIAINPSFAPCYYNRGNALQELKRLDEALASYDQAIRIKPDYADAYWNKSLALLLDGQFTQGWQEYEWRWKSKQITEKIGAVRAFTQPLWLGEQSFQDKTILLYGEQGLGDTIQFCRYADLVSKLGAKVILEVQPALVPLLKDLEGVSQIIAKGTMLPEFDYQCPLLSLPLAFKTVLETIPSSAQYIQSDNIKVSTWRAKLGEKTKLRVGIVWSGSTGHKNDHNRSLTLAQIVSHLPSQYQYICLQKELREIDKLVLSNNPHIQFYGDDLKDFTDTAALCELMDVVISVDTSVAHLAGALGKPTWVLLPYAPDWRWLLDRVDSPWYPSATLYRQEKAGDWDRVLDRVKADLINI